MEKSRGNSSKISRESVREVKRGPKRANEGDFEIESSRETLGERD